MEVATLNVQKREARGTDAVRKLRGTGLMPLVLYGGPEGSVSLQVQYPDIKRHFDHHLRVYKLTVDGQEHAGFLKSVQWDCLTDEPLHADFLRIDMETPLAVEIDLVLIGHPMGEAKGGRLIRDLKTLMLKCLPASVPEHIEMRIDHLDVGAKVRAKDIELPEGCSIDMPEDKLILHVTDPDA